MTFRTALAALAAIFLSTLVFAHGGGGGGGGGHGHGGRSYVTTVFIGGGAGGVSPPPDPEVGDYSQIHTVAILSAIGQSLEVRTPGSIFTSRSNDVDIANWGLDDFTAADVNRLLSTRFQVKAVTYNRAGLAAVPVRDNTIATNALKKYLGAVANTGIDAFVIVRPDDEGAYPAHQGLEVFAEGSRGYSAEWLGFEIEIIDAHTFRLIGKSFARLQYRLGAPARFASFLATPDRSPGDTLVPSDAQVALLTQDFKHHLAASIGGTLRSLQLGLPLPPPGDEPLLPLSPQEKPFPNIRTVAIVSAIGDSFSYGYRAPMFDHGSTSVPTPDSHLDSDVESTIAAELDKRFTVKNVAVDRAALAKVVAAQTTSSVFLMGPIAGLPTTSDVDAYIVVVKRSSDIGIAGDTISGVGVWKFSSLVSDTTGVYASYELAIVDSHTLMPIGHVSGVTGHHWPNPGVFRPVDNAVWPSTKVNSLAEGQSPVIQQMLHDMMVDSLGETLLVSRLTGMRRDIEYGAADMPEMAAPTPGLTPPPAPAPAPDSE